MRCACAVEPFSAAWSSRNADVPDDKRIEFRIGINLGDIIIDDDDIYGDGVNVAARLEGLAEPGGRLHLSRVARDQVRDKLDLGLRGHGRAEAEEHRAAGPRLPASQTSSYRCKTSASAFAERPAPRAT